MEKMGVSACVCACRTGRWWRIRRWRCGTRIFGTGLGLWGCGDGDVGEELLDVDAGEAELDLGAGEDEVDFGGVGVLDVYWGLGVLRRIGGCRGCGAVEGRGAGSSVYECGRGWHWQRGG